MSLETIDSGGLGASGADAVAVARLVSRRRARKTPYPCTAHAAKAPSLLGVVAPGGSSSLQGTRPPLGDAWGLREASRCLASASRCQASARLVPGQGE